LHPGKTLGSAFSDSRFCRLGRKGTELFTDDIETAGSLEAMTVFGSCLSQVSELVELLSSPLGTGIRMDLDASEDWALGEKAIIKGI